MDLGIRGKTALVTGASKGIGRSVAQGLAAEGARVVLSARNEAVLSEAAEAIRLTGGEGFALPADVSRPASLERLFERLEQLTGAPDIVVVNGGGPPPGLPSALDEVAWSRGYDLTLMPAVRLARLALPAMKERRWGRIINITSLTVKEPLPTLTLSNAYRAAVTGYAKTLALEVAADGVTVNNVAPGYTATERLEELFEDDAARKALLERIPMRRFASPEEIADVAVFLASQQASYLTGQTITPEGGAVAAVL